MSYFYVHFDRGQFPARQYLVPPESGHSSLHGEQRLGCFRIFRRPHPRQRPRHAVAHRDPFRVVGVLAAVYAADVPHDVVSRNARGQHARQQKLKANLRMRSDRVFMTSSKKRRWPASPPGLASGSNRSAQGRESSRWGSPDGIVIVVRARDVLRRGRVPPRRPANVWTSRTRSAVPTRRNLSR